MITSDEKNYEDVITVDEVKVGEDLYVNVQYDYSVKINQYVTINDVVATRVNKWDWDKDTEIPLSLNDLPKQTYDAILAGFPMQWLEERIKFHEGM